MRYAPDGENSVNTLRPVIDTSVWNFSVDAAITPEGKGTLNELDMKGPFEVEEQDRDDGNSGGGEKELGGAEVCITLSFHSNLSGFIHKSINKTSFDIM